MWCRRSWDFGIYVAITSSHPFRAYVYNDIVLRFCPAQYVDPVVDPAVSLAALTAPTPSFSSSSCACLLPHVSSFLSSSSWAVHSSSSTSFRSSLYTTLAVDDPAVRLCSVASSSLSSLSLLYCCFSCSSSCGHAHSYSAWLLQLLSSFFLWAVVAGIDFVAVLSP